MSHMAFAHFGEACLLLIRLRLAFTMLCLLQHPFFRTMMGTANQILIIVLAGLISVAVAAAADTPGPMNYLYTYSNFAYNDSLTLVEFTSQFSERGLLGKPGETGRLYQRLKLRNFQGAVVVSTDWISEVKISNTTTENGRVLMGVQRLAVKPGVYSAQILYRDMASGGSADSQSFTMKVRAFNGMTVQASDLQITPDLEPSDATDHPFYKNGFLVRPNIATVIAAPFLVVNSYIELYHVNRIPTSEFFIRYSIADTAGRRIKQEEVKRPRTTAKDVVELHTMMVDELPSGEYYLIATVFNGYISSANDSSQVVLPITIRNPDKDFAMAQQQGSVLLQADLLDPIFAGLKESELETEFRKVKPIATEQEVRIWNELQGTEAKGRFLTQFWLKRDQTIGTPANEFQEEYFERLRMASAYSYAMAPSGWESDRGRVLLKYGKPDNIERHLNEFNLKPYHIWSYQNLNYQFVFVDRSQTEAFNLVHSTAPGEPRNEDWLKDYAEMHRGTPNSGSRDNR